MSGRLTLCATPIGNLEDTSHRAIRVLGEADAVACEDPRRLRKLLTHFGIHAKDLIVYNEGNERRRAPELVRRVQRGEWIVLASDAGMPGISDPGYRLVTESIEKGIEIDVVPGPNAAVSALVLSGLPTARFAFEGFLPRKAGERSKRIEQVAGETRTLIFYVSPHHAAETARALLDGLGDRSAALARELTKLHEEVLREGLRALATRLESEPPKGEMVLVVEGAPEEAGEPGDEELAAMARALMKEGLARSEALSSVAKRCGVPRRRVFDALLKDPGAGS